MSGAIEHSGPREACGVFGIYAPGRSVAPIVFDGLYALQHRGQESAGMAVSDGSTMMVVKDMGLVTQVFNDYKIASLVGHLASWPYPLFDYGFVVLAQRPAHVPPGGWQRVRGRPQRQLDEHDELAASMAMLPGMVTSDSDLIAELVARDLDRAAAAAPDGVGSLASALVAVLPQDEGGVLARLGGPRSPDRSAGPQWLSAIVPGQARRRVGAGLGDTGARHRRGPFCA